MRVFAIVMCIFVSAVAEAQVISTAETSGKDKTTYLASINANRYAGVNGSGGYIWIGRGLTDQLDIFTIDGWSTVPHETQGWVGAGANYHFAKLVGWDMSLYQYLTVPVNRRDEASTVLYDACWINSRHVGKVVPYVGVNAIVPMGKRYQSTFTPPKTEYNVPLGLAVPAGPAFIYFEVDAGKLRTYAAGVSLTR